MNLTSTTCAFLFAAAVFHCAAFAEATDSRNKLFGSWQAAPGNGSPEKWVIEDKGDTIHIAHSTGAEKPDEVRCNTSGRDCEWKREGKKGTVSMYFNGSKLIQLETRGSEVVKRRFTVAPDENTLEIEVIPVVPAGETRTQRFTRSPETTASK